MSDDVRTADRQRSGLLGRVAITIGIAPILLLLCSLLGLPGIAGIDFGGSGAQADRGLLVRIAGTPQPHGVAGTFRLNGRVDARPATANSPTVTKHRTKHTAENPASRTHAPAPPTSSTPAATPAVRTPAADPSRPGPSPPSAPASPPAIEVPPTQTVPAVTLPPLPSVPTVPAPALPSLPALPIQPVVVPQSPAASLPVPVPVAGLLP